MTREKRWSYADLAEATKLANDRKLSETTVRRALSYKVISYETAEAIAYALDKEVEDLFAKEQLTSDGGKPFYARKRATTVIRVHECGFVIPTARTHCENCFPERD